VPSDIDPAMQHLARRAKEFAATQKPRELAELLGLLDRRRPQTVIEIGTLSGGTLFALCQVAEPDAVLVSVDLPGGRFGGGCTPERVEEMKLLFPRERQKLHFVRADSHDPATLERVNGLLGGRTVDFLFIDGDHTHEGVRQDFEMYSPLVGSGGLIGFHDILRHHDRSKCKVSEFWEETKDRYRNLEIVTKPDGWGGIGLLWQK